MKRLAIISSGEYARQIVDCVLMTQEYEIIGFIDSTREIGEQIISFPVIGQDKDAVDLYEKGIFDCVFIGLGYAQFALKEKLYHLIKGKIPLANIIHHTAIIYPGALLGEGIHIGPYCIIGRNTVIEDNVSVNHAAVVGHNSRVRMHSYIAARAAIAGKVLIGCRCFIGFNCSVRDGITIGNQSVLGMGGVFVQNIGEKEIWCGNPGRLLKFVN